MTHSKGHQLYINDIRKALGNGNAVVMIGAGFSLNAYNGHHLKDWLSIGHELKKAIEGDDSVLKPVSAQEIMDLGEQYEALFGRTKLNDFLKKMLPDEIISPGSLHEKLLELPWNDVFTTNYDTLLERAADNLINADHKYFPVYNAEDLPQSRVVNTKRIIKLHGSFPSNEPFIFTAEDYRTYPQKFAPFINTVKQALLENTMCLLGFSGSDPNFLEWIGWIRDILNEHTLPIYLMLSKMPSLGEQRVLASRHITPVLYPIPDHLDDRNSSYAERINHFLELINPHDFKSWPDIPDLKDKVDLQKAQQIFSRINIHDSKSLENIDINDWHKAFSYEFRYLEKLRKNHPGWLITPNELRLKLKYDSIFQLKIFDKNFHHKGMSFLELPVFSKNICNRIWYYSYHLWIKDLLLESFDTSTLIELVKYFSHDLEMLRENKQHTISEEYSFLDVAGNNLSEHITSIVKSLLAKTRRYGLFSQYKSLVRLIQNSDYYHIEIQDEISYQEILKDLYLGDHVQAKKTLDSWSIQQGQFLAQLRKSNLLLELNLVEEAEELLKNTIKGIRLLQRHQPENAYLISIEAYVFETISRANKIKDFNNEPNQKSDESGIGEKTLNVKSKDLRDSEYDIDSELLVLISRLNSEDYFGGFSRNRESAYSLLMMYDLVGLSFKYYNVSYDKDTGLKAAWLLQFLEIPISVSLSMALRMYDMKSISHRGNELIYYRYWFNNLQLSNISKDYLYAICQRLESRLDQYCDFDRTRNSSKFSYDIRLYPLILANSQKEDIQKGFEKLIHIFTLFAERKFFMVPEEKEALKDSISAFIRLVDLEGINKTLKSLIFLHKLYASTCSDSSQENTFNIRLDVIATRIKELLGRDKRYILPMELQEYLNLKIEKFLFLSRSKALVSNILPYIFFFLKLGSLSVEQKEKINQLLSPNNEFNIFPGYYGTVSLMLAEETSFEEEIEKSAVSDIKERLKFFYKEKEITGGEYFYELHNIIVTIRDNFVGFTKSSPLTRVDFELMIEIICINLNKDYMFNWIDFKELVYSLDVAIAKFIAMNFSKRKQLTLLGRNLSLYEEKEYFFQSHRALDLHRRDMDFESWNSTIQEILFEILDLPSLPRGQSSSFFSRKTRPTPDVQQLLDLFCLWYVINEKYKKHVDISKLIEMLLIQMTASRDLEYLYIRCLILYKFIFCAPKWFDHPQLQEKIFNKIDQVVEIISINSIEDQMKFKNQLDWLAEIEKKLSDISTLLNSESGL